MKNYTKNFIINTNVNPEIEEYLSGHFPVKPDDVKPDDFRDNDLNRTEYKAPRRRVHHRDSEFRRTARAEARERYLIVKDLKRARRESLRSVS